MDGALQVDPDDAGEELVMVMPRRELWAVSGLLRQVPIPLLDSLQEESWFACPSHVAGDLDCKQVRLGVIIRHGERGARQVLVSSAGVLLHATPVPIHIASLPGSRLRVLRDLAATAGRSLAGVTHSGVELAAVLNTDKEIALRQYVVFIYMIHLATATPAAAGMSWISASALSGLRLDSASSMVLECIDG